MKKQFISILLLVVSLSLASCLTTLVNLATYDNIVQDNRLTGNWNLPGTKVQVLPFARSKYSAIFSDARKDNKPVSMKDSLYFLKLYVISYTSNEVEYYWIGAISRIGGQQFISLVPDGCFKNGTDINIHGSKETVSYGRIEWVNNNEIRVKFLNGDHIKQLILDGKVKVRYEYDPLFGNFLVTASENEMKDFMLKYGTDERLYEKGITLKLTRKPN